MATSVRLIRRYVWLVDTIRRAHQITLEEINQKWLEEKVLRLEDEAEIPERTFHRHRQAIADIFGIDILCNRYNGNIYYIDNEEALDSPTFTSWLFNGLSLDNQMIGNEGLSKRIVFEDIPGGMEHMPMILNAMNKNKKLLINYDSIWEGYQPDILIEPYFIKQRLRRWYLIANVHHSDGKEKIKGLAFDRIDSMQATEENFKYDSKIDPEHYFDEVIGIQLDEEYDCEKVVVRLYNQQARYMQLLPLHKSQREVGRGEDYIDFEYTVRPEWEFIHEILRLGREAEVLSPVWVREEIPWQAGEIVKRYNSDLKLPELLFLDFDGVLNTKSHQNELQKQGVKTRDNYGPLFDPKAVEALRLIITTFPDMKIIITSSWRYMHSLSKLKEMWKERGLPGKISGILPTDSFCETRGEEIQDYLIGKNVEYIIIDDEDSYSEPQKSRCFIVNPQYGLSKQIAEEIVNRQTK